jgi:ribonucleoside-diphosphate reductase beta chain
MKEELYALSKEVVQIELNLVDRVFDGVTTDVINPTHIKNYIHDKANKQLKKVGLNKTFKVDKEMLKETEFFDIVINGASVQDFFSSKETNYSKGILTFNDDTWK